MSFSWFRRHEKPFLWAAVVFTVAVFAFFPSFGSLRDLFEEHPGGLAGTFVVAPTGEPMHISGDEFNRTKQNLARWYALFGRSNDLEDDDVWRHILWREDAKAAGLRVTDDELVSYLRTSGFTPEQYNYVWQRGRFASPRSFDDFLREQLLAQHWAEIQQLSFGVVDADQVYQQWKVTHERFDFVAADFPDEDPAEIPDPGEETLRAWFDAMPTIRRDRLFVDPAREDLVFGWLPLDADLAALPPAAQEDLTEPDDDAVQRRFAQVRSARFPDLEKLDDATRELLRHELTVIGVVRAANAAFNAGETKDKPAFLAVCEARGLRVLDPEGLLGPDGIEALDPVGSAVTASQLGRREAGQTLFVEPFGEATEAHVAFVEDKQPERPLSFEEAGAQVLEQWRKEQVGQAARDFRQELRDQARELPDAQEAIAPLLDAAKQAADAAIAQAEAGGETLDADGKQALRDAELEKLEPDIQARVAPFEHELWDQAVAAAGVELLSFEDVPRDYAMAPDEDDPPDSAARFLKSSFSIFEQDVDGITGVLRHAAGGHSYVVRVTGRRFPDEQAMLADTEGFKRARDGVANSQARERLPELEPQAVMAAHQLEIPEPEEPPATGP